MLVKSHLQTLLSLAITAIAATGVARVGAAPTERATALSQTCVEELKYIGQYRGTGIGSAACADLVCHCILLRWAEGADA